MGFFGELFSDIGSMIDDICSAIGLGPIGDALAALLTTGNPLIALIIVAIPLVCEILELLAPDEVEPGEVASGKLAVEAKVCQDIKPEDYDSYSAYIKAIHEDIENDPAKKAQVEERMETRTEAEATGEKVVSVAIAGKLVAEKLDTDYVDPVFIGKLNACGFDADKTVNFIKELKEQGLSTTDVNKYFDGNLSTNDYEKAGEGVRVALGKIDPSLKTDEQKTAEVNGMFDKIDNAVKDIENANS